jgi:hypothetical protein
MNGFRRSGRLHEHRISVKHHSSGRHYSATTGIYIALLADFYFKETLSAYTRYFLRIASIFEKLQIAYKEMAGEDRQKINPYWGGGGGVNFLTYLCHAEHGKG